MSNIINSSETNKKLVLFIPNEEQKSCIIKVNNFIEEHKQFSKLLINGSAGTGKTTIIISSIVNIIIKQIINNIDIIQENIINNTKTNKNTKKTEHTNLKWDKLPLNIFIISAPTNKAKDVLVTKYNTYIEDQLENILENIIDSTIDSTIQKIYVKSILNINLIIQIINSKITFLTVSQVLSIGRVINEMGVEEFTKGNDKKITDKYNKSAYLNTSIIVDECSMIDKNTSRLLELIKCPIIYIGDYCQLPPVNEELSNVFTLYGKETSLEVSKEISNISYCINLKLVERCKNDITLIANLLRNKIYDITLQFNLLKHTAPDLIIYNKKFSIWLETYLNDIKQKQKQLDNIENLDNLDNLDILDNNIKVSEIYDTMALGWTNKCCLYLNKKIRELLFSEIKNIDTQYIIKGDKLLIKTPYYKYENHIYSSNIVYVSKVDKKKYKAINFKEWCDINIILNELQQNKNQNPEALLDIDINNILESKETTTQHIIKTVEKESPKISKALIAKKALNTSNNILNYFSKNTSELKDEKDDKDDKDGKDVKSKICKETEIKLQCEDLQHYRKLFYTVHILNDVISNDLYIFTDEISMKYNLILPKYDLHKIKYISSAVMRSNIYTKWHKTMSTKLFGIPNDRISCKKCSFFIKKFTDKINADKNQSNYISDFIDATNNLEFEIFLCDLVTFTKTGKNVSTNIPILDMNKQCNTESLENIRNIIKNSYEIKLMLSKQDENELNSINKLIGEESISNDKQTKYITMSQMFGHYMSHVITSSYLEIDYGYVLTVHKSQGSTYDNVYIEYSNILSNLKEIEKHKLLYTAITRCINKLHVYY